MMPSLQVAADLTLAEDAARPRLGRFASSGRRASTISHFTGSIVATNPPPEVQQRLTDDTSYPSCSGSYRRYHRERLPGARTRFSRQTPSLRGSLRIQFPNDDVRLASFDQLI
jgi:hypothetical protein